MSLSKNFYPLFPGLDVLSVEAFTVGSAQAGDDGHGGEDAPINLGLDKNYWLFSFTSKFRCCCWYLVFLLAVVHAELCEEARMK